MATFEKNFPAPPLSGTSEGTAERLRRLQSLHPKIIDLSLGRIERLLRALGHPEKTLPPIIHVAGTNGKGSVVAYVRAVLEAAGRSVHVYTSPHLVRFNERIRLAGHIIGDDELCQILEECERVNGGQPITFFEATTAAAFLAFSRMPAGALLLETGLGGRLDATNVIEHPAVTAITPIGYDHQQFLGDALKGIAEEKAGILKPGVPAVIAEQKSGVLDAISARGTEIGAPLFIEGRDWVTRPTDDGMVFEDGGGKITLDRPGLAGPHQIQNAGVAIACVRALLGSDISPNALGQGLAGVRWPARLQRLDDGPLAALLPPDSELWLDGGHNPLAGHVLKQALLTMTPARALYIVVGMLNTKDAVGFLGPLAELASGICTVPIPDEPAGLKPEALAETVRELGIGVGVYCSVAESLEAIARDSSTTAPRVLICGSLYLAGRVLRDNGMDDSTH
ncbi:MAG: bifunctional folylpolyglutamate synthase/dihydrofolate synthase [Rhodospirillales bacterium]|nr:bifunctional folylpolyglutamate synthase/dihydrofolate synthase [Rhodospirillales bacterium]